MLVTTSTILSDLGTPVTHPLYIGSGKMNGIVIKEVRASIVACLHKINPYDALEKQHLLDTIAWVNGNEQIFRMTKPDKPNKHLVAYFIVFDALQQKVLLVEHKKAQLWLPTGGHVEINEHPTETVTRECMEELFIQAQFWCKDPVFVTQTVTVGHTAGHTDVSLWYVIKGNANIQYQYDQAEFTSIQWFKLDEIPYEHSDPHLHRFINKWMGIYHQFAVTESSA